MKMRNRRKELPKKEIQKVQNRYATEQCSQKQLAEDFGVSVGYIKKILKEVVKWELADQERFWSKVDTSGGENACWEWLGTKDRYGYGRFWFNGKMEKAHRLAYQFTMGLIPEGQVIRHKICRNSACCNPNHLLPGTDVDNQLDKMEDGTNWRKLSYMKVLEAIFLRDIGWSNKEIAEYLGVKTITYRLSQLDDIETQQTYQERAKGIFDKEDAKNNPPIEIIIDRIIE